MTQHTATTPVKVNGLMKVMLNLQVFLLRRNWMGGMGHYIMAITTTGRQSGHLRTIPIGYLLDGDMAYAINPHGRSNWFKNVLANPEVELVIKGQTYTTRGALITDPLEIARVFDFAHFRSRGTHKDPRQTIE